MSEQTIFLFSMTVAFPALVGLVRMHKVEHSYYPFLIYIFASVLNELLVWFVLPAENRNARTLDWQLFNLFEAVILVTQFYYWRVFSRVKRGYAMLLIVLIGGWILENFIFSNIYQFNPVFPIAKPFILVLLSVQTINHIIVNQNRSPLSRNAMFIICVALVIYFIYNIFVYTLQAKGISKTNKVLMGKVFEIMVYINAFTNILFGIAACFIPERISRKNLLSRNLQSK